jgi:Na+-driven multidrug efflux pump
VIQSLQAVCEQEHILTGRIQGIGACGSAAAIGTAIGVIGFSFHDTVIIVLGATESLYEDCLLYLIPMLIFAPVMVVNFIFDYFFVTAGKLGLSLGLSVLSGAVNITLDYVLIAKLGWGISGAAWATVTSYAVATVIAFFILAHPGHGYGFVDFIWNRLCW